METNNSLHTENIKKMLSLAGCPTDLQGSYLKYLQSGGQQVHVVRSEVSMMFQKQLMRCQRHHQPMEGSATFSRHKDEASSCPDMGIYIGLEFISCCFSRSIPARITTIKRIHGEITELTISFGMTVLELPVPENSATDKKTKSS